MTKTEQQKLAISAVVANANALRLSRGLSAPAAVTEAAAEWLTVCVPRTYAAGVFADIVTGGEWYEIALREYAKALHPAGGAL